MGWEWTFFLFGALGMILLPVWLFIVRDTPAADPSVSEEERRWIGNDGQSQEGIDWPGIKAVILSRTGVGVLLT